MMEFVDETPAKIVVAASPGDSIRHISQKIGGTYSWVHTWVTRLEEAGILVRDDGVRVTNYEVREQYDRLLAVLSRNGSPSIEEAYVVPHFAGLPFAYVQIDAVYVWTRGGYQIARGHDDYPVFMRVNDHQVEQWRAFFDRYGIPATVGERPVPDEHDAAVHYVLFPTTGGLEREWVDGDPVVPLEETIAHMREYRANYEPALEMIADEYGLDIDVEHDDPRLQA